MDTVSVYQIFIPLQLINFLWGKLTPLNSSGLSKLNLNHIYNWPITRLHTFDKHDNSAILMWGEAKPIKPNQNKVRGSCFSSYLFSDLQLAECRLGVKLYMMRRD